MPYLKFLPVTFAEARKVMIEWYPQLSIIDALFSLPWSNLNPVRGIQSDRVEARAYSDVFRFVGS